MTSRRKFLLYSAAGASALTAPAWGGALTGTAQAATSATCPVALVNNTASKAVYAYIVGCDPNYQPLGLPHPGFIKADGTWYHLPTTVAESGTPLPIDPAIPLSTVQGAAKTVKIPHIESGRLYFAIGSKLAFYMNPPGDPTKDPRPGIANPDAMNSDKTNLNYLKNWTFFEFTFNDIQLFTNISYVDLICAPIALTMQGSMGTQKVPGFAKGTLNNIAAGLAAQHQQDGWPWDQLVTRDASGGVLRINAPHFSKFDFVNYYESYIQNVWDHYSTHTLTVDTGNGTTYRGTVQNDVLTFPGLDLQGTAFTRPDTAAVFSCNSGPFTNTGPGDRGAVSARLAAAFNRSTLLLAGGDNQPNGVSPANYYPPNVKTNHYARLVHEYTIKGYAFPYDEVVPTGQPLVDGQAADPAPTKLTVAVGNAV